MKSLCNILLIGVTALAGRAQAQQAMPLRLVQTIPLPNVEGRIDHMAVDVKGQRLFIAALGNNTIEVLDLRAGKRIRTITGLREPQGIGFVPELNRIFVANSKNGACDIFDGSSFQVIKTTKFSDDADNVRYDAAARRVYVGYGGGGLGVIDATNSDQLGSVKLDGHPESFQLEKSGRRIFVNIPASQEVAVVDRGKRVVTTVWPISAAKGNFPMALDEDHHRLFVGARKPAKLLVFNTESGKLITSMDSPGDADDMFYDETRKRIYISGGEGSIGIVQDQGADHYIILTKITTASGARTSFYAPEFNRLYLAVPHRGGQNAELRVYETEP